MNKNKIIELQKILTSAVALAPECGGNGEIEKCNTLKKWLLQNGFKSQNIEQIDVPDERVASKIRPSLILTIPGKDDSQKIWVISHLDVVPSGDLSLWKTNPWEAIEKDGKIYGRGVEDNQQGLCSSIFAALYFVENQITPSSTVKLLFVADEENGSQYGITHLLEHYNLIKKEDLVIIPDGGDSKGKTIEIAEKNIVWLDFLVHGKQTHGSRPDSGANACLASCDLAVKIHDLEKVFNKTDDLFTPNYSTIQPTKRAKNVDSINIIPGEDNFCIDCRLLPCYSIGEFLAEVQKCIKIVEEKHKVQIEYRIIQQSESPATSKNAPVVQKLANAIKSVNGFDAEFIGIGGGTVGAELRRKEIDCVVWSTLEDMAHQPNEYCVIENLVKDAKVLIEVFR